MFHLRCYTLRKLLPFIDAGFQGEQISVAFVKSNPVNKVCFFKQTQQITFRACFASNFYVIASHRFYLTTLQKTTPPKSLYLPQLNFQINKSVLDAFYYATFMLVSSHQIALDVLFQLCKKMYSISDINNAFLNKISQLKKRHQKRANLSKPVALNLTLSIHNLPYFRNCYIKHGSITAN